MKHIPRVPWPKETPSVPVGSDMVFPTMRSILLTPIAVDTPDGVLSAAGVGFPDIPETPMDFTDRDEGGVV